MPSSCPHWKHSVIIWNRLKRLNWSSVLHCSKPFNRDSMNVFENFLIWRMKNVPKPPSPLALIRSSNCVGSTQILWAQIISTKSTISSSMPFKNVTQIRRKTPQLRLKMVSKGNLSSFFMIPWFLMNFLIIIPWFQKTSLFPGPNPAKKFKYSFSNAQSSQQKQNNRLIKMEVLSYLNAPSAEEENDLSQLGNFSNIRRIFKKFNTLLTSSASAERIFPFDSE